MAPDELSDATGCRAGVAANWADPITETMARFAIDQGQNRMAMFLATCAYESCLFSVTTEIWGNLPAQLRYEGRAELGNTEPGDGRRFLGRGAIMATGRHWYTIMTNLLGHDFIARPQDLALLPWASDAAGVVWQMRELNSPADAGDFERVTRIVNGAIVPTTHYADRLALLNRVTEFLERSPGVYCP